MTNRKTIRKEKKNGRYTTVDYKVLRNTNLTPIARLLLIEILSDTDDFTLSQTLYCNRLGIDKKQFQRAIINLIENGYMSRNNISKPSKSGKVKIIYSYTISEYGNLVSDEVKITEESKSEPIIKTPQVKEAVKEINTFQDRLNKFKIWYVSLDQNTQNDINDIASKFPTFNTDESEFNKLRKAIKQYQTTPKESSSELVNRICDIKLEQSSLTIAQKKGVRAELLTIASNRIITEDEINKIILYRKNTYAQSKRANLDQKYQN